MGAPRATVSPNTHSVGLSTRLVTITAITPDGKTAITVDKGGTEVRVPMNIQRSKGILPAVGEQWIVAQDITNSYSFSAIVSASSAPFTTSDVTNENTGGGGGGGGIPGSAIAPGTITGVQIAPQSIDALHLASLAFGTSIILDPQFSNALINADRLADPGLQGTWAITPPAAVASGTHIAILPLMPSNLVPLYVNQGEQYYLSVQVSLSGGTATAGIQFAFNNGSFLGPDVSLAVGANTVAQMVTIPSGVVSAYVRLVVSGLSGANTASFTAPTCYISSGPNQIQAGAVTANSLAANSVTASAIAANSISAAAIQAGAVTASAISAGAVTATAIQAGTVVAGMVNGTTISGAQFVAFGSTGEILVYSGTPANGNLIASISATGGTDGFSNVYVPGAVTYSGNSYSQITSGVLQFQGTVSQFAPSVVQTLNQAGFLDFQSGKVSSGDTAAEMWLASNAANGNSGAIFVVSCNAQFNGNIVLGSSGKQVSIPQGGGPFILGETFHDVSGGSGFLARVKLLPWNAVWLDVEGSWSGTGTTNLGSLPSSDYYPTSTRKFPVASTSSSAQNVRVFVPTSGALQVVVSANNAAGDGGCSVIYPTN